MLGFLCELWEYGFRSWCLPSPSPWLRNHDTERSHWMCPCQPPAVGGHQMSAFLHTCTAAAQLQPFVHTLSLLPGVRGQEMCLHSPTAGYLEQFHFESQRRNVMRILICSSCVQAEVLPTSSFHFGGAGFDFSPGKEYHFTITPAPMRNQHLPLHTQPFSVGE